MLPTVVTDGTVLKIYAWYDNEVGYACRVVDLADIVIRGSLACRRVRSPVSCWRSGRSLESLNRHVGVDQPGAPSRLAR